MKSNLNKIILCFVILFFLSSCHTFEHQNFFIDTMEKNQNQKLSNIEYNDTETKINKINKKKTSKKVEMIPIKVPKQKKKVKTVALNKKVNFPKTKIFNLNIIKNWSEKKLVKKMGQSDFLKEEGRLKNYQYYFSSCFLDVFLLKKGKDYYVNYVQTRSTKLYGKIKPKKCLREINSKLN